MKILQLSSARAFGGGERHFADLSNALSARGHDVYAAISHASPLGEKLTRLPAANITTLPLRNALDIASATRLARFIREHEIQIVHAHLARDYPLAAYAARRARSVPFVLTRHVPFPVSGLHKFTLSNVARVIAVSEGVARGLRASRIFPDEKIRVVPNGISVAGVERALKAFDRAEFRRTLSAASDALLVGTVGELSQVKGQEEFVRAAALIVKRENFTNARFIIVGDDRSRGRETRALLEKLIAEHALQEYVSLVGHVAELAPLIGSLDIYVSASRAEAFGLATLEALMCGVATVATATDGAREMIDDGATGKLVPVNDADALAGAILRLLQNDEERARLSERAREESRARFGLERMVDATEKIYREVLTIK
ncbi:MAG TPA: glycosyltransferase family 4 protein [Pyrinomonadaceae bacterium]|nr:glycosyltransferase family 4 protein [Pyrinomonadaceae bacterium]